MKWFYFLQSSHKILKFQIKEKRERERKHPQKKLEDLKKNYFWNVTKMYSDYIPHEHFF